MIAGRYDLVLIGLAVLVEFLQCREVISGGLHLVGPNRPVEDGQGPMIEVVLTIKPLDNLSYQLARKCDFIERPALNARVNIDSCIVAYAGINESPEP